MFALRTLRSLKNYTVTVINTSLVGNPNAQIGQLSFTSGGYDRTQPILNLPVTNPYTTQPLNSSPDAGTTITWNSNPQNISTNPTSASLFHASNLLTNLNVFIGGTSPIATLQLTESWCWFLSSILSINSTLILYLIKHHQTKEKSLMLILTISVCNFINIF